MGCLAPLGRGSVPPALLAAVRVLERKPVDIPAGPSLTTRSPAFIPKCLPGMNCLEKEGKERAAD